MLNEAFEILKTNARQDANVNSIHGKQLDPMDKPPTPTIEIDKGELDSAPSVINELIEIFGPRGIDQDLHGDLAKQIPDKVDPQLQFRPKPEPGDVDNDLRKRITESPEFKRMLEKQPSLRELENSFKPSPVDFGSGWLSDLFKRVYQRDK